jgi:protocatechuate 3,4-dioxygenase beta subunit
MDTMTDTRPASQNEITAEIEAIEADAAARVAAGGLPELQPRRDYAPYRSSLLRHPTLELVRVDPEEVERVSPAFGHTDVNLLESDLTIQHAGEPIGERSTVSGRVLNGENRPVRHQLIELWQAMAAGRYVHKRDQHPGPARPQRHRVRPP